MEDQDGDMIMTTDSEDEDREEKNSLKDKF